MIDLPDLIAAEHGRHVCELAAIDRFYEFCRGHCSPNGKWHVDEVEYELHGLSVSNLVLSLRPVLGGRDYFFDAHKKQESRPDVERLAGNI